jgi:2-dehydro-3-deoxy-L-rhamnonate dehydrogenase (NAD+)
MSRLEGQAAIVTGAVRGIGLGIARRLAAEGCSIVVWDRDVTEFDPVSAGFTLLSLAVDVASPECTFTTGATFDLSGGRATY